RTRPRGLRRFTFYMTVKHARRLRARRNRFLAFHVLHDGETHAGPWASRARLAGPRRSALLSGRRVADRRPRRFTFYMTVKHLLTRCDNRSRGSQAATDRSRAWAAGGDPGRRGSLRRRRAQPSHHAPHARSPRAAVSVAARALPPHAPVRALPPRRAQLPPVDRPPGRPPGGCP